MLNRYRRQLITTQIYSKPDDNKNCIYYYEDKSGYPIYPTMYLCSLNSLKESLRDGHVIYIPFIYNGCSIQVKGTYYDI